MEAEESSFPAWIKQRRRAIDLTQEDLAECVGCSRIAIQKIELGERRPSKQVALRLSQCLRLPADEQEAFVRFARGEAEAGEAALAVSPQHPEGIRPEQAGHSNPSNLPSPLTFLLGRGQAVAAACGYLLREDIRLLTVTGAPGIGKTRLSLQVAADLLPYFRDGVYFVELAPITDPSQVAAAVATTLGLTETSSGSMHNALKNFLTGKRMLLVLDNFEQVLDAASLVIDLLSSCPSLKVLVTSREALHVPGEQQFPVSPLDLPDLARLPDKKALPDYPAIALFLERARAIDPNFGLNEQNARDISTICIRLDGLPLAIELAAARVRLLSTAEMLARLDKQLNLLAGPARHQGYRHIQNLPARQQTMRAAIEWSYQLLEPKDQQLLAQLGVFVGGWTLEASEAVCGPGAVDGMESLLGKSLSKTTDGSDGERRFTLLESIREYALERLSEAGEGNGGDAEEVRRRHALYFLGLAERAEPYLKGEEQVAWFRRLERDHSNMVAAMSWSLARDEQEIALRFGGALTTFWHNRYPGEGRWWVEGAMKGALTDGLREPSLTRTRARALYSAAMMLRKTREYPQARALFEESLQLYRALDDKFGIAIPLHWLANLLSDLRLPADRALMEKMYEESLELYQVIGDRYGMAGVLMAIGEDARIERDYPQAIGAYDRSMALQRETKDKHGLATSETNLAYVLYHCADYERAKDLLSEALRLFQEVGSPYYASSALFAWAGIVRAQGDPHSAATVIGAADVLAATAGAPFDPIDQQDREEVEATVRADLSDQDWRNAQEQGRAMSMDEVIDYALSHARRGS